MVLDLHALPTFHSFEAQYLEKVGTNSLPFQCPFFLQMDQASLDTPTKENTHKYEHYRVNELKLKKKKTTAFSPPYCKLMVKLAALLSAVYVIIDPQLSPPHRLPLSTS